MTSYEYEIAQIELTGLSFAPLRLRAFAIVVVVAIVRH